MAAFIYRCNENVFSRVMELITFGAFIKIYTAMEGNELFSFQQKQVKKAIRTKANIDVKVTKLERLREGIAGDARQAVLSTGRKEGLKGNLYTEEKQLRSKSYDNCGEQRNLET